MVTDEHPPRLDAHEQGQLVRLGRLRELALLAPVAGPRLGLLLHGGLMDRRVNIKAILADPKLRAKLLEGAVAFIVAMENAERDTGKDLAEPVD